MSSASIVKMEMKQKRGNIATHIKKPSSAKLLRQSRYWTEKSCWWSQHYYNAGRAPRRSGLLTPLAYSCSEFIVPRAILPGSLKTFVIHILYYYVVPITLNPHQCQMSSRTWPTSFDRSQRETKRCMKNKLAGKLPLWSVYSVFGPTATGLIGATVRINTNWIKISERVWNLRTL